MRRVEEAGGGRSSGERPGSRRARALVALAFALLVIGGGCVTRPTEYHEPPPLSAAERTRLNLRVFDRAWEIVNDKYFDAALRGVDWRAARERYRPEAAKAADDTALYAVLNRMCAELKESHLAALAPRRAHELRVDRRVGVGIRWQIANGKRVVADVVPGSPAAMGGVKRGWLVVSRNGGPVLDTFVSRLGQPVTYGFLDQQDRPITVTLLPELINFDRLESRELADGIVYLRFDSFDHDSLKWLNQQLKAHAAAPGVVIDLRDNSGGNGFALDIVVADFFRQRVDEGLLVQRNGHTHESHSFNWFSAHYSGRVVLLTGPATASAAEIFSHVLQHYGRATVIGQRTAAAVIYSQSYSLPGGGRIQVPTIDYIGLDGKRLEGRGVTPDLVLPPPSLAELRSATDADLAAAMNALEGAKTARTAETR